MTVTRDRAAELAELLEHARAELRDAVDTRTRIAVESLDRAVPEYWRQRMAVELTVADLRVDLWRHKVADLARSAGVPAVSSPVPAGEPAEVARECPQPPCRWPGYCRGYGSPGCRMKADERLRVDAERLPL